MKATKKIEKDFDAVKMTRAIKEKISREIAGLDLEQLKAYFAEKRHQLYSRP